VVLGIPCSIVHGFSGLQPLSSGCQIRSAPTVIEQRQRTQNLGRCHLGPRIFCAKDAADIMLNPSPPLERLRRSFVLRTARDPRCRTTYKAHNRQEGCYIAIGLLPKPQRLRLITL